MCPQKAKLALSSERAKWELKKKSLEKISPKDANYHKAQLDLYKLYWSKPLEIYPHLDQRYKDIQKALQHLSHCMHTDVTQGIEEDWARELKKIPSSSQHYPDAQYRLHCLTFNIFQNDAKHSPIKILKKQLHEAYKYLLNAIEAGNHDARFALYQFQQNKSIPNSCDWLRLQQLLDAEFKTQLKKIAKDDSRYCEAQTILFEIYYYSNRCYKIYEDDMEREDDIFKAFKCLIKATEVNSSFTHAFIDTYNLKNPTKLEKMVSLACYMESHGKDRVPNMVFLHSEDMVNYYLNEKRFTHLYKTTLKSKVSRLKCEYQHSKYHIKVTVEQLKLNKNSKELFSYIDFTGQEIARHEWKDNKIFFHGFAHNIKLNIIGLCDVSHFEIYNQNGSMTLLFNNESKDDFTLVANTDLDYEGKLKSLGKTELDVNGKLKLSTKTELENETSAIIRSNSLNLKGKITTKGMFISRTKDVVEVRHSAQIFSAHGIDMTGNHFNDMRGKLHAIGPIEISSIRKMNIHGGAVFETKTFLKVWAEEVLLTDSANIIAPVSDIHAKTKIVIDKNSKWKSDRVKISTDKLDIYSELDIKKKLTTKTKELTAHRGCKLKAFKWKLRTNSAYINEEVNIDYWKVKANRMFALGYADTKELWDIKTIKRRPKIKCKQFIVHAMIYSNLFTNVDEANFNLICLIEVNLGLTSSVNSIKKSAFPLNLGVELPNFSQMLKATQHTFKNVIDGNFSAVIDDLCSKSTLVNGLNFLRWGSRRCLPGCSQIIDMGFGLGMFIVNSPNVYRECKKLYFKKTGIEFCDLLPLIGAITGLTTQAFAMSTQISAIQTSGMDSMDFRIPESKDIPSFLGDTIALFPGNNYSQSIFKFSADIKVNNNVTESSVFAIDVAEARAGLNVSEMDYYASINSFTLAKNYSTDAKVLDFKSRALVETVSVTSQALHLSRDSNIQSHTANFMGNFTNDEVMALANNEFKGVETSQSISVMTDSDLNVNHLKSNLEVRLTAKKITINQEIKSAEPVGFRATDGDVEVNSNLDSKQTSLISDNGKVINRGANIHSKTFNNISGKLGVESFARTEITTETHKVPSYEDRYLKRQIDIAIEHREKHEIEYLESIRPMQTVTTNKTKVIPIVISTDNGGINIISSSQGAIEDKSINYVTPDGHTYLHAFGKVDLGCEVETITTICSDESGTREKSRMTAVISVAGEGVGKQIVVISDAADVSNSANLHPDDSLMISAYGSYKNTNMNDAKETIVSALTGNVYNNGDINGKDYVEVTAPKGYVFNTAIATTYQGKFDKRMKWLPAVISGGEGRAHNNIGTFVYAGLKVDNYASRITGIKGTVVYGKEKGVDSEPGVHRFISNREEDDGFFGFCSDEQYTISTEYQQSVIASNNGPDYVMTDPGIGHEINLVATILSSQAETKIIADEGQVNIYDIVTSTETYTSSSSWFGLSHSERYELNQNSVANDIFSAGQTTIQAHYLVQRSPVIIALGGLNLDVDDGIILPSELKHEIIEKTCGLTLSAFGIKFIDPTEKSRTTFLTPDPTLCAFNQLSSSNNPAEFSLNAANLAANGINSYQDIAKALQNGNILTTLGQRYGVTPSNNSNITIGFTKAETRILQTSYALGFIYTSNFIIKAKNAFYLGAIPLHATGDMTVQDKFFYQNGIEQTTSYTYNQSAINITPLSTHYIDVGIEHVRQSIKSKTFFNQQTYIDGTLTVNISDRWEINGAKINVNHINGTVDRLQNTDHTNSFSENAESFSASTAVTGSYQSQQNENVSLAEPSGIRVRDEKNNDLRIGNLEGQEGCITGIGRGGLHAEHIKTTPALISSSDNVKHGFTFNVPEFERAFASNGKISDWLATLVNELLDSSNPVSTSTNPHSLEMKSHKTSNNHSASHLKATNANLINSNALIATSKTPHIIEKMAHQASKYHKNIVISHGKQIDELSQLPEQESKHAVNYLRNKYNEKILASHTKVSLWNSTSRGLTIMGYADAGYEIYEAKPGEKLMTTARVGADLACASLAFRYAAPLLPEFPFGTITASGLIGFGIFGCSKISEAGIKKVVASLNPISSALANDNIDEIKQESLSYFENSNNHDRLRQTIFGNSGFTENKEKNTSYISKSDIIAAGASLMDSGLGFFDDLVTHTTLNLASVKSILAEVKPVSHPDNLYGGKAFYVAQNGWSHTEVYDGSYTIAFRLNSHNMDIQDNISIHKTFEPLRLMSNDIALIAEKMGLDGVRYEGWDHPGDNIAIFKPKHNLRPIGVYPVPSDEISSISPRIIRGIQGASLLGTFGSAAFAVKESLTSETPVKETIHQTSLLGAGYYAGMLGNELAILPCATLGASFPPLAPVTVPVCIVTSSLVLGSLAVVGADLAWKAGLSGIEAARRRGFFADKNQEKTEIFVLQNDSSKRIRGMLPCNASH